MTYFLELLNNVFIPFMFALAVPVFGIAIVIFIIVLVMRKGYVGRAWYIIGVPLGIYLAIGLLWALANIVIGASSVPDDDLLPSASYQEDR